MKNLKYILFINLIGIFLFCSTLSKAEDGFLGDTFWQKGDHIVARAVCKDESDIMEMVAVDILGGLERVMAVFNKKLEDGECKVLQRPSLFIVHSVVTTYTDYMDNESLAFALAIINDENKIIAYTISQGKPMPLKQDKQYY
tara:strand:- start:526 stop:951 length:426 start_codon:yes stop_codon:yes gene_type:complete